MRVPEIRLRTILGWLITCAFACGVAAPRNAVAAEPPEYPYPKALVKLLEETVLNHEDPKTTQMRGIIVAQGPGMIPYLAAEVDNPTTEMRRQVFMVIVELAEISDEQHDADAAKVLADHWRDSDPTLRVAKLQQLLPMKKGFDSIAAEMAKEIINKETQHFSQAKDYLLRHKKNAQASFPMMAKHFLLTGRQTPAGARQGHD